MLPTFTTLAILLEESVQTNKKSRAFNIKVVGLDSLCTHLREFDWHSSSHLDEKIYIELEEKHYEILVQPGTFKVETTQEVIQKDNW